MPATVLVDFSPLNTPTRDRGIGRYLQTLALGLSRLGPADLQGLRVLALLQVGWSGRPLVTDDFVGVLRHPWAPEPSQADRYRWAYARRVALFGAARRLGARLVHLGDPNATPLAMPLSGCRRVVTCHDLIPLQFPEVYLGLRDGFGVVGKRLLRRRFRSADHVVAISDATRDELIRLVGVPPDRVTRVHNGIDLTKWSPEDPGDDGARLERHGLRRGRFLVYVGDTDWRKNAEGMIAGLGSAVRRGADVQLAFAGRLEPFKVAAIRQLAARHEVLGRVLVLGYVSDSDLRALYRGALAHLFVSRFEGFGYTVVEAMASGCPVITTHCGSLSEVAGDAALLVDPDDHEAIGSAIVELDASDAKRTALRSHGLQWAQGFSCVAQAGRMIEVFRQLVE